MFNAISRKNIEYNDTYVCLSSDTKDETGKGNGDILIEIDTGKVYFFNANGAEGNRWLEFSVGGGS